MEAVLERNFEELDVMKEREEERFRYHEDRTQKMTIAYLVGQRVLFFALVKASSSYLKCAADWTLILILSLLWASIYFMFFLNNLIMLYGSQVRLEIIYREQARICRLISVARATLSIETGPEPGGEEEASIGIGIGGFLLTFHQAQLNSVRFGIVGRKIFACFLLSALLAVTAVELYAANGV